MRDSLRIDDQSVIYRHLHSFLLFLILPHRACYYVCQTKSQHVDNMTARRQQINRCCPWYLGSWTDQPMHRSTDPTMIIMSLTSNKSHTQVQPDLVLTEGSLSLSVSRSVCLAICLSLCLSICLSLCLSLCKLCIVRCAFNHSAFLGTV